MVDPENDKKNHNEKLVTGTGIVQVFMLRLLVFVPRVRSRGGGAQSSSSPEKNPDRNLKPE